MININDLEAAFASVEDLGRKEVSFTIGDIPVVIRHITDEEEVNVMKYASVAFEGEESQGATQDFIHRMKTSTLAHALVQVGDSDLRFDLVDTGKEHQNGNVVKREKVEVVRTLLAKWPKPYLTRAFARYGELATEIELDAEKAIEYEPIDFDAEISRLESRIEELRTEKERHEDMRIDVSGKQLKAVLSHNQNEQERTQALARDASEAKKAVVEIAPASETALAQPQQAQPQQAQPQVQPQQAQPQQAQPQAQPQVQPQAQPQPFVSRKPESPARVPLEMDPGTFLPNDMDHETAVAEYNARLFEQKRDQIEMHNAQAAVDSQAERKAQQAQQQQIQRQNAAGMQGVPQRPGRVPPHIQAAEAARSLDKPEKVGVAGETEVYRMPAEVLSPRGRSNDSVEDPVLNSPPPQATNPKFRPPRR